MNTLNWDQEQSKRSRVEGDKRIEEAGIQSGPCRVGSFAPDGFGVVGPTRVTTAGGVVVRQVPFVASSV